MSEILIENRICDNCEADVRKGALFCYHCGSSVAPDLPAAVRKNGKKTPARKDAGAHARDKKNNDAFDQPIEKPAAGAAPPLRTAANLRKTPKSVEKKKIEIVWEEPETSHNLWFVLAALFLSLFALGIWLVARYLK